MSMVPTFPQPPATAPATGPLPKSPSHHTSGTKRKREDGPEDEESDSGRSREGTPDESEGTTDDDISDDGMSDEGTSDEGTSDEGTSDGGTSDGSEDEDQDEDDDDASPRSPHRLHRHYRLVVKEVCLSLDQFTQPSQLVSVILDCLSGKWHFGLLQCFKLMRAILRSTPCRLGRFPNPASRRERWEHSHLSPSQSCGWRSTNHLGGCSSGLGDG